MTIKLSKMAFENPWGPGSPNFDKWMKNDWDNRTGPNNNWFKNPWATNNYSALSDSFKQFVDVVTITDENFPIISVNEVISLTLVNYKNSNVQGQFNNLKSRVKERNKRLSEVIDLSLAKTQAEKDAIERMNSRFSVFFDVIEDEKYDITDGPLSYSSDEIDGEKSDIEIIKPNKNLALTAAVAQNFLDSLSAYVDTRKVYRDEEYEYQRLDGEFYDRLVTNLVKSIPQARFWEADIKAIISQESSDLTNKALAGITDKKDGIVNNSPNNDCRTCIGIAQMQPGAEQDARTWAALQGVGIPDTPDPRTITAESIKLCASYLGSIVERYLIPKLPGTIPTGVEFKKLAFGAYNCGFDAVVDAAKSCVKKGNKNYTWDDLTEETAIINAPGQPIVYVEQVTKRLGVECFIRFVRTTYY